MIGPLDGVRIAVVSSDAPIRDGCVAQLRGWGAIAEAHAHLHGLGKGAETCDAVVVFDDGWEDAAVVTGLNWIERLRSGPVLVFITDRTPPPWQPTIDRDRPAEVVPRFDWAIALLKLVGAPTEPELPHTD